MSKSSAHLIIRTGAFLVLLALVAVVFTVVRMGLLDGDSREKRSYGSIAEMPEALKAASDEDTALEAAAANATRQPERAPEPGEASEEAPPPDDEALMTKLRGMWLPEPETALELAEQAEHRFTGTPRAAECAWIAVRSLVELGDFDAARAKAREMQVDYPGTHWAMDVKRHLLIHPPGS